MRVRFVNPPIHRQAGGIENAVEGLRDALSRRGMEVVDGADPDDADAIHHFHGLWEYRHSSIARSLAERRHPFVVSPHGMLEPWAFSHRSWKKRPYFAAIEKRYLLSSNAIFVTSQMEKQHLEFKVPHSRVEVLPLGCRDPEGPDFASARALLGWRTDEKVGVYVSRIDRKKGLDLLIRALAQTPEMRKWRWIIVGDGDKTYRKELKELEARYKSQLPAIEWAGAIWGDQRWPYFQGADLFCLPTHSENFGICVVEAMLVGTPVLTTDQTPWKDHDGEEGIFIAKPEVESLSAELQEAAAGAEDWTEQKRKHLSGRARDKFLWENLVDDYLTCYSELTKSNQPTGH